MGSTVLFEQLSIVQRVWRMSSTIESIGRKKKYIQQAESLMCGGIAGMWEQKWQEKYFDRACVGCSQRL